MAWRTKDNEKARKDLVLYCDRPNQHLSPSETILGKMKKPMAPFALDTAQKRVVLTWLKNVRFPDGYASNWDRCVNLTTWTLTGLKSHNLHVFMERVLPVVFWDFVPNPVWNVLCEISAFFREICAKELDSSRLKKLEADIIVTMCKTEKKFPPGFFDSMEHLVVRVAYKARMGGPVGSRWMYPCERRNKEQRMRVTNKTRVEGSIVKATIAKEIGTFSPHYFADKSIIELSGVHLSIFDTPGHPMGRERRRPLSDEDWKVVHTYVILNCPEISKKYMGEFDTCMINSGVATDPHDLPKVRQHGFADWLRKKVLNSREDCDDYIRMAGITPSKQAYFYDGYEVNGYRFHTQTYGRNKVTQSSSVCIKGEWDGNDIPTDYYGVLQEDLSHAWKCSFLPLVKTEILVV